MNTLSKTPAQSPSRWMMAAALVALTIGVSLPAAAMPGGHRHGSAQDGPGLPMMGDPAQVDRLLDSVNATSEQRTQVRQLLQAASADLKAEREAGRALHEQARQLFVQPTVDARAAEALRQQMLGQHDRTSQRMLQAMLDVSRVLTPEQRKQMVERTSQHQAMMRRHQAERDALDKPAK